MTERDPTQLHRDSFIIYRSFIAVLSTLSSDDCKSLLMAMSDFALDGKDPSFDNASSLRPLWILIEPQLRANRRKAFNGSKGGQSKTSNGKHTPSNGKQEQANVNDNDNANVNGNGNKGVSSPPPKTEPPLTPEQAEKYQKFKDWLKAQCPHVARMEKQLSFALMEKLMNKYGKDNVFAILRNMDNYKKGGKPIEKNYTSVYQTANNWLKADAEKEGGN